MSRANSTALTADFSGFLADLFGTSDTAHLMIWTMRKAQTWVPLGALTQRIAGKLLAMRQADIQKDGAAEVRDDPRMRESAAPACVGQDRDGVVARPQGGNAGVDGRGEGGPITGGSGDRPGAATVEGTAGRSRSAEGCVADREVEPATLRRACSDSYAGACVGTEILFVPATIPAHSRRAAGRVHAIHRTRSAGLM